MHTLNSPILFLVFNRPDTTEVVFQAIKKAKPGRLYIAADGPRENRVGENQLCAAVRDIVLQVDWDCKVLTLFRSENLGCMKAVSEAISWFFDHEEEGIILEDDCNPSVSFFDFCDLMLHKYRSDERIAMITGTNYSDKVSDNSSYFFSQHFTIWGWATWKRAWDNYDVKMEKYLGNKEEVLSQIKSAFNNWYVPVYYDYLFKLIENDKVDTWDIQWVNCCLMHNQLCIVPPRNLISNIGIIGTHSTKLGDSHLMKAFEINIETLNEPVTYFPYFKYDTWLFQKKYKMASLRILVKKIVKRFV